MRQDRSPQPSNAESDIGGALHGCRAGYGLAERDTLLEVILGEPTLARHRQALDIGDHRGTAKRHGAQTQKGKE